MVGQRWRHGRTELVIHDRTEMETSNEIAADGKRNVGA